MVCSTYDPKPATSSGVKEVSMKNIIGRYLRWSLLTNLKTIAAIGVIGEALARWWARSAGVRWLTELVERADRVMGAAAESVSIIRQFRHDLVRIERGPMDEKLKDAMVEGYKGNVAPAFFYGANDQF